MKKFLIILFVLFSFVLSFSLDITKLNNWKSVEKTAVYHPDNLWEYINGAADAFLSFGFKELSVDNITNSELSATVSVYDMETDLNAFGIYITENPKSDPNLKVGAKAVLALPYQLLLLKGKYYVKVDVVKGKFDGKNGQELLKNIAEIIPGDNNLPQEITLLPEKNRVLGSIQFSKENFLGLAELSNCISGKYKTSTLEYKIFLAGVLGQDATKNLWKKLSEKWSSVQDSKRRLLIKKIPYTGIAVVEFSSKGIIGVVGLKTEKEAIDKLASIH